MKRSIMLMGGKTYVISLPAGWVKNHGLEKGQEIDMSEDIGRVVITAGNLKPEDRALSVEYSKEKLIKAYQLGYDEIKVTGKVSPDELQQTINDFLPGFEVMTAGRGYFMLKCVTEADLSEFDALLKRAFLLLSNSRKSALRLISMCKRCISKKGYRGFNESLVTYSLLCDMEKAANSRPKAMQELHSRFTNMGFEDISPETPFANPMKEIALARA
ncbi:MAG: hypothetical protein PHO02_03465 [Candidatus Nanoarchaeia archaeon]|nr:hypothetical protein [Candidatus Nanoarchaeia archaeon]